MNKFICKKCGESFENGKIKSNHVRWKHGNLEKYKQSIQTSMIKRIENTLGKLNNFDVECHLCKKIFKVKERERQFPIKEKYYCSRKCANTHETSIQHKNKTSNTMKRLWNEGKFGKRCIPKLYDFTCIMCGNKFQRISDNWTSINHPPKTCSNECYRKRLSQSSRENPNCGGETNYKKYKYKGIWMDSTWEKDLAEWMDSKNIIWERSKKLHQFLWTDNYCKKRRYYPDFYLPKYNLYVDTKNPYLMKCDDEKIKSVIKENNIKLICGNIDFVKKELTNHISE